MTYIELSVIDAIPDDYLLLAWAELRCLATGRFSIEDLQLDREVVLSELEAFFPGEDVDALASEPGIALERVLEELELKISTEAKRAVAESPFDYPFEVQPEAGVILSLRNDINGNVFGASYLAMQLEQLYRNNLVNFWNDGGVKEKPEMEFLTPFRRVFEVVSAISVANIKNGIPVLIGESRSVDKALLPALEEVCALIGTGQAKSREQLSPLQRQANDGGIDAIIISRDDRQVFECVFVGATTQQSNLREKVMGADRKARINGYFINHQVLGPQSGILTHSNPFDEGAYAICNESGCGYFAREKLLANLAMRDHEGRREKRNFLRSIRGAREPLISLSELRFRVEFDLVQLPCAG